MPRAKAHVCKWCPHRTLKKEEHWEHIKTHLDPKKLLVCKSCPFVTEYKHHLEYHLRNHTGLKPFKCDRCAYQCVNKSMLKSHQKSHSPECPFRCTNCGYTTKYAHSLKMHFRKYHQNEHHDRIMNDVFGPKSENITRQSGSGSTSPASISTTISTPTATGMTTPTQNSDYSIQEMEPASYSILDLRIESKIRAG